MCLAVPGKITEIGENFQAEAEVLGIMREVNLRLVPDAKVGDYVLIHAGFAIQVIDEQQAKETQELFEELAKYEPE